VHAQDSIPLLIIALGAFVIPIASGRIGIPSAVGEILYGACLGPHVLGLIAPTPATEGLFELGFAFLMFLAGLELDFSRIERQGPRALLMAIVASLSIFAFGAGLTAAAGLQPFLFVAVSAVSVGVVMATLNETGHGPTLLGQTIILVGFLGEFWTIVALTAVGYAAEIGVGWMLAAEMGKLLLVLVAAYLLLVVLRTWIWWYPDVFARLIATRDPSEIGVRAGVALMLVFVTFAAIMGVKSILGAFLAGALFSFVFRQKGILEAKMSSIGFGFFVPVFFIGVGTSFDLPSLITPAILPTLALLMAISVAAKLLAAATLWRILGARGVVGAGLLLATPLTLLVVTARVGLDTGMIDRETGGALVLLAIATSVVLPPLFKLAAGPPRKRAR
jgi:Kef-type K+ transport system membrane component KefB